MSDQISHPEMVRKLFKDPHTIKLAPEQINLLHAAIGVVGEVGEVLELLTFSTDDQMTDPARQNKLLGELGDVSFYVEAFDQGFGCQEEAAPLEDHRMHCGQDQAWRRARATAMSIASTTFMDLVKKMLFNNREGLRPFILGALADIRITHRDLCSSIGCSVDDAKQANIAKLGARYQGFNYSDDAAAARRDEE